MFGGFNENKNDSLENLALRSIQCGMEIQKDLKEYDSNEGFILTLHIGIGAGKIYVKIFIFSFFIPLLKK